MDWAVFVVQWVHVLLGIFWFGAVLVVDFVVIPAITKLPFDRQREASRAFSMRAKQIITPISGLVIVFGFLRGTIFGPIKSFSDLMTPYGLVWLFAFVLAIGLFLWGLYMVGGRSERLNADDSAWVLVDGKPGPSYVRQVSALRTAGLLELVGFLVLFTCMILMRFGVAI